MLETVLVDADIVAYRCAAACENEAEEVACWQTSEMMNRIVYETNAMASRSFLTGDNNFRYLVNPDYKANRRDVPRPKWLQQVRAHLVQHYAATVTDGIEADDQLGIEQCAADGTTCIASIDKDLLMIPGMHYNFVKQEHKTVTPLEGLRHFYFQLIMGDRSDNILGYDGKMRQKVPKFLEPAVQHLEQCMDELEMYEHVRNMYNDDERFMMSARCLWIWRKDNDLWKPPVEQSQGMDSSETQSIYNFGAESSIAALSSEV